MTGGLFAVAWLLKICLAGKCIEVRAPALYACQMRAAAMLAVAPETWKLTAECLVVSADKTRA